MKYQPKHLRDTDGSNLPDNYDVPGNGDHGTHDGHALSVNGTPENNTELPQQAHPSGIPIPEQGSSAEYVPMPGDNRTVIAPNGAIIRNPWSEQPEVEPDNEYTPDKEDLNLLIM